MASHDRPHAREGEAMTPRPYTPESLALHWGVSATSIRNMCQAGDLRHFRVGRLYRIPAAAVEEFEKCQTSASDGSGAGIASIGEAMMETGSAISLRHAPERRQRQRR